MESGSRPRENPPSRHSRDTVASQHALLSPFGGWNAFLARAIYPLGSFSFLGSEVLNAKFIFVSDGGKWDDIPGVLAGLYTNCVHQMASKGVGG